MDIDVLLETLYSGPAPSRLNAAHQLGVLGESRAVGPLIQTLKSADAELAQEICESLGSIGDARAVPPLVSMLRHENEDVRGEAFAALLRIGQERARFVPPEVQGGQGDPHQALTQIAWPADLEAIQLLIEALQDEDPEIRIGAAYTLGRLGIGAAYSNLRRLLLKDPDLEVRIAVAFAMGELGEAGDSRVWPDLVSVWQALGQDTEAAVAIIRALGLRPQRIALPILIDALRHGDERVRQLGVMALSAHNETSAHDALERALRDSSANVQRIAMGSLAQMGRSPAIPHIFKAAVSAPAETRLAAAESLGRLERKQVDAFINDRIDRGTVEERSLAAFIAGRVGPYDGLGLALRDIEPEVRKAAALAMGTSGRQEFRELLEGALTDGVWFVKVAAAEGLKRLGDPVSLGALQSLKNDEHPVVQNAVRAAISTLSLN